MAKKKFNSHFYCISYIDTVPLAQASDDIYIECYLRGNITKECADDLVKDMQAIYNGNVARDFEECPFLYSVDCIIPKKNLKKAKEWLKERNIQMSTEKYVYIERSLPDGYLYAGWRTKRRTKIKPEDLPESYVKITNYKKLGYLDTANVCDVVYKPSPFHNHTFKDDFLYISYTEPFAQEGHLTGDRLFSACDEYIFGNSIIPVIAGIEKNNPDNQDLQERIKTIKQQMVQQYNLYVDEMTNNGWRTQIPKKIERFEDLLGE